MTSRHKHAAAVVVIAIACCCASTSAYATDPIGDFFKRVGRTLSKPHPTPARQAKRKPTSGARGTTTASPSPAAPVDAPTSPQSAETPAPPTQPLATPPQPIARPASSAPQSSGSRDLPYGVPVANRPGFVTSPYAPTRGFVDVRDFPSGTEVRDPYTGKVFRTP